MTTSLTPARTAQLFADLTAQQQAFPTTDHPVPLPACPACHHRPRRIRIKADGTSVWFERCGHLFSLSRPALLAGLAAQRA